MLKMLRSVEIGDCYFVSSLLESRYGKRNPAKSSQLETKRETKNEPKHSWHIYMHVESEI